MVFIRLRQSTMKTFRAWPVPSLAVWFSVLVLVGSGSVCAGPPIRIQCIGDSTTVGYTDIPVWSYEFDFGYRLGLYHRLTAAGYALQYVGDSPEPWTGEYGLPRTIGSPDLRTLDQDHHRGYAWLTAGTAREEIVEWMERDDPDVILLMVGRIDFPYGSTSDVGAVQRSLSNLVERIVVTRPEVHLIVAEIAPFVLYEETLVQYNRYIRDVLVPHYAGQNKRVTSVDQHANFLLPGGAVDAIDVSLYADGWQHADSEGNDRIAQTWFEAIRAIFPSQRITVVGAPALLPNGHFHVVFNGAANVTYRIDRSIAVGGPWQLGFTNLTANASGFFELEDPSPGSASARFYRVVPP